MHFFLFAIILTVFSSYLILVIYLITGWLKSNSKPQQTPTHNAKFSIIIPFRDEILSIKSCIQSLCELNYPKDFYELILVNDNSTDNSAHFADEEIKNLPNAQLLNLTKKKGKKAALELGISMANIGLIMQIGRIITLMIVHIICFIIQIISIIRQIISLTRHNILINRAKLHEHYTKTMPFNFKTVPTQLQQHENYGQGQGQ